MRERRGLKVAVVRKIEKGMLKWFEYMERINKCGMTKEIYRANVDVNIGKG